jgi:hypothetical protein
VSGGPETDIVQTFQLLERAENLRLGVVYQGVGHGAFHNGGGSTVATGPCQVGRQKTHKLMRGLMLPLIRHFVEGELDAYEWLWRSFDSIQPLGAPSVEPECIVVGYEVAGEPGAVVIDDHQSQLDPGTSSSGTAVTPWRGGLPRRAASCGGAARPRAVAVDLRLGRPRGWSFASATGLRLLARLAEYSRQDMNRLTKGLEYWKRGAWRAGG